MKKNIKKETQSNEENQPSVMDRVQKRHSFKKTITKDNLHLFQLKKEDRPLAQSIWQYVESQTPNVGLTSMWSWVESWIEHYEDVVDYFFIGALYRGRPCGIAIITRETNRNLPLPVRSYHIGTGGEPYKDQVQMINNQVLATQATKNAFCEALVDRLAKNYSWDEIVFDDYNNADGKLMQQLLEKNAYALNTETKNCKYFDFNLLKGKGTVLSSLDSDIRYWIRRSIKILGDDLTIEWADDVEQALDIFDELAYLFQQKWTSHGQRGIFASKRYVSFHQTLISRLIDTEKVILFRVSSKQYGTVGCLYMFIEDGVAYGYQIGLQDFTRMSFGNVNPNRIKVGYILHTLCMEECLKRGLKAYNFSTGEYSYKKDLTNAESQVMTLSIRQSIRPYLRESAIKLHNILLHSRSGSLILRPIKMLFT